MFVVRTRRLNFNAFLFYPNLLKGAPERIVNQMRILGLHALIVGIDRYANIAQLSGAVADANSMSDYLTNDLAVPASQITNLRDGEATRSAIIQAFVALRNNPDIKPSAPILIYYAGHGTEVDSPDGKTSSKVQCILSQDVKCKDGKGQLIPPIPAYMVSSLLSNLAEAKGNNITVIFDCCHSEGGTKGVGNILYHPRVILRNRLRDIASHLPVPEAIVPRVTAQARSVSLSDNFPTLHTELDRNILSPVSARLGIEIKVHNREAIIPGYREAIIPGYREAIIPGSHPDGTPHTSFHDGMRPYVLLAACGKRELAYECSTHHRGYFTSNLLHVLRNEALETLTYKRCIEKFQKFDTPGAQSPVCEGEFVDRCFFNADESIVNPSLVPVIKEGDAYYLAAGIAHGFAPRSVLTLHANNLIGPRNPPLGAFMIQSCTGNPFRSRCLMNSRLSNALPALHGVIAYALLLEPPGISDSNSNMLRSLDQSLKKTLQPPDGPIEFGLLNRDQFGLSADDQTGDLTWEAIPEPGRTFVMGVLPHAIPTDAEHVKKVLLSMQNWNWHVSRVPESRPFVGGLQLELHALEDHEAPNFGTNQATLQPLGGNLARNEGTEIIASSATQYGITITNHTNRQLYAYPFYFSTIKQSIRPLFLKVFGNESIDPALESGSSLTIGYGNDDIGALTFQLDEQIQVDVGVFRIFVTTAHSEFDFMAQPSPFLNLGKPWSVSENMKAAYGIGTLPTPKDQPGGSTSSQDITLGVLHRVKQSVTSHTPIFLTKVAHMVMDDSELEKEIHSQMLWDVVETRVVIKARQ